jgi:hypothetical protein
MRSSAAVYVGGEPGFVAHIFRGDNANARRTWVCVRSAVGPVSPGWLGCWSCTSNSPSKGEVERFVGALAEKVRAGGRMGPMGPFLDGHYFFEGWDTWGTGIPWPILAMTPDVVAASADPVADVTDFSYRG